MRSPIQLSYSKQEAQLSQRDRAAAYLNFGKKYKCEKRASNIALCYVVNIDESSFYCSMASSLYLMQN